MGCVDVNCSLRLERLCYKVVEHSEHLWPLAQEYGVSVNDAILCERPKAFSAHSHLMLGET